MFSEYDVDDSQTIADEDDLRRPNEILCIILAPDIWIGNTWEQDKWLFQVGFEEVSLCLDYFHFLEIKGRPASDFVSSKYTQNDIVRVQWKAEWRTQISDSIDFDLNWLQALVEPGDWLRWNAKSSMCMINGGPEFHVCQTCDLCRPVSTRALKRKSAVDYVELLLEGWTAIDRSAIPALAQAIVGCLQCKNPLQRYCSAVQVVELKARLEGIR